MDMYYQRIYEHGLTEVFGLTRSGFEPTIYRNRGEHANHYTADAVQIFY